MSNFVVLLRLFEVANFFPKGRFFCKSNRIVRRILKLLRFHYMNLHLNKINPYAITISAKNIPR